MNCYRCGETMDGEWPHFACSACGLAGEADTSDSMRTFTFGFLDSTPSQPEDTWAVLPPERWDEAPAIAVRIARKHAEREAQIARLDEEGWCVVVRGLLEIPLHWQSSRTLVVVWAENRPGAT